MRFTVLITFDRHTAPYVAVAGVFDDRILAEEVRDVMSSRIDTMGLTHVEVSILPIQSPVTVMYHRDGAFETHRRLRLNG